MCLVSNHKKQVSKHFFFFFQIYKILDKDVQVKQYVFNFHDVLRRQLLCDPHLHSFMYCTTHFCTDQRFGWNPPMYMCVYIIKLWNSITHSSLSLTLHLAIHSLAAQSFLTAPGRLHNCGFPTPDPHVPETQYTCTIDWLLCFHSIHNTTQ